jgi:hypothetical protein
MSSVALAKSTLVQDQYRTEAYFLHMEQANISYLRYRVPVAFLHPRQTVDYRSCFGPIAQDSYKL